MEKVPFGYEYVDGKLVPHPIGAAIIKFRFEKNNEYAQNPPAALIQEVVEEALANGEVITEEDAKSRVRSSSIDRYVVAEIFKNPEWKAYLESLKSPSPYTYQGDIRSFKTEKGVTVLAHEGIIDPETWASAQGEMKNAMEAQYGSIVF